MAWIKDEIGRAVGLPATLGGIPLDEIGATGWGLVGDARLVAANPLDEGIYVVGFSYPVVPRGPGPHPRADQCRARARAP